ncbi:4,5-dihydroxyphthalate decarboxylase [Mycobacterium dioxanotrophicus]|jgi:4,5-dihydroxyphthalate decarboxylase|uniref:4,5-dihydroxyphthalate decarboxylase n=1 Tax=Mycobacterium dioxanotrophicus TaxID=482462 RepID=A0A1Y0C007_9MYCO|nr:4,5-dihydroxyphthalate decarboxylase [Mycobacterium dioxanotrophicus]ART68445.1 4,5-dihydroxyphthalate decarboxylase [Mycobacterium dioxanotrophicus]
MSIIDLDIGFHNYEHVSPLIDGTVPIAGVAPRFHTATIVSDIFERMLRGREFGVAELGLTYYLRTLDLADPPFIALPVFLARQFRHSAIFVNRSSGIEAPEDLIGKTVGEFALYGHDAGVTAKGMLSDEYGVRPEQCRWVIGGFDWPMAPFDFVPQPHPADVAVTRAGADRALGPMLDSGELDALISADVPACVIDGSPNVARLFDDYLPVERDYFVRTGIFPIMHTVVIRRDLVERHPGLARSVYRAFCDAKDVVAQQYRTGRIFNHVDVMTPWISALYDDNLSLFGADWWPYGVAANRRAVDAFLRWHFEQQLSLRRWTCEDIFVEELLDT